MSESPSIITPPEPVDDVRCVECGYTLRAPAPADKCPECGCAVAESIEAAQRRPDARLRALRRTVRALELALATHWMILAVITIMSLADASRLARTFAWLDSLGFVVLLAVPIHLIACWVAGECALAAHARAPTTCRRTQWWTQWWTQWRSYWRLLARFLPIAAAVLLLIAIRSARWDGSEALVTAALALIVLARAATLATGYDALRAVLKEFRPGPTRHAAGAALWLAVIDGAVLVVATLITLAAISTLTESRLLAAVLITAAVVSTATLICGTVATVSVARLLRREWRHLK